MGNCCFRSVSSEVDPEIDQREADLHRAMQCIVPGVPSQTLTLRREQLLQGKKTINYLWERSEDRPDLHTGQSWGFIPE